MPLFEFFFAIAVIVSLYISIEDIRHERIPNKLIALLLFLGIVYQALFVSSPLAAIALFSYALFISFMLWFLGLWPAGDAKLFTTLILFLPQQLYSSQSLIFDFLVNTFVPIFFFMFFVIIARSKLKLIKDALRFTLNPYNVFMLSVILLGFVWFLTQTIQLLTFQFPIQADYFITLIFMFIIFEFFRRFLSAKLELFFFGCAVLRVLIDYRTVYSFAFAQKFFTILFVFLFFRFFILYLAFKLYTYKVPIRKLKPGMSLAEVVIQRGDHFEKKSFLNASLIGFMTQRRENIIHSLDFLTKEDVDRIKKLRRENKIPFASILVNKVQPFAIFILLGYILTVFCQGSFMSFLVRLLK
ncbi:MAG: prepilin peptidase [Candidatus Diapherotrites archaeon]|nr:prepilin peptidase [Candidatus Diapherotrites archaeon]